jgi:hypothetical protein
MNYRVKLERKLYVGGEVEVQAGSEPDAKAQALKLSAACDQSIERDTVGLVDSLNEPPMTGDVEASILDGDDP